MSHKKFGLNRFSRFDVYWIQTNKQTNKHPDRQAKFIYRFNVIQNGLQRKKQVTHVEELRKKQVTPVEELRKKQVTPTCRRTKKETSYTYM